MKISFDRIILFVQDVEMLKGFYMKNFLFTVTEEIKNEWVVLNTGGAEIAFHKIGSAYKSEQTFKTENNTKLVFKIENDLAGFRKRLLENAVLVGDIKSFPGTNYLLCDGEDPEGNVFQLKQNL